MAGVPLDHADLAIGLLKGPRQQMPSPDRNGLCELAARLKQVEQHFSLHSQLHDDFPPPVELDHDIDAQSRDKAASCIRPFAAVRRGIGGANRGTTVLGTAAGHKKGTPWLQPKFSTRKISIVV